MGTKKARFPQGEARRVHAFGDISSSHETRSRRRTPPCRPPPPVEARTSRGWNEGKSADLQHVYEFRVGGGRPVKTQLRRLASSDVVPVQNRVPDHREVVLVEIAMERVEGERDHPAAAERHVEYGALPDYHVRVTNHPG